MWLRIFALAGVAVHLYFAYKETCGWGPDFVTIAAPSWMRKPDAPAHVAWAKQLAFNVGAYNLALAIGLAWIVASGTILLGMFITVWLLIAAAAAAHTRVWWASGFQGSLAVLLGITSFWML